MKERKKERQSFTKINFEPVKETQIVACYIFFFPTTFTTIAHFAESHMHERCMLSVEQHYLLKSADPLDSRCNFSTKGDNRYTKAYKNILVLVVVVMAAARG